MRRLSLGILAGCVINAFGGTADAAPMLDTEQSNWTSLNGISATAWTAEGVTLTNSYLTSVDVAIYDNFYNESVTLTVFGTPDNQTSPSGGTFLTSKTIIGANTSDYQTFAFASPIDLTAYSNNVVLQISASGADAGYVGSSVPASGQAGGAGAYFSSTDSGASWTPINGDLVFRTYTQTVVPEPASLASLGLIGMGLMVRRRAR